MVATPTDYTRYRDYSQFQSDNPDTDLNGADLDTDFDRIKTSIDQANDAIGEIRRADGALRNAIVGPDSLSADTLALIGAYLPRGEWETAEAYAIGDVVDQGAEATVGDAGSYLRISASGLAHEGRTPAQLIEDTGASTSVPTLAALKALTTRPALVEMLGRASSGDGGGGTFWWDDGSSTTADDALVVQCTSGAAGRYKRVLLGPNLNTLWWGVATSNTAAANSTAIQAALDACEARGGGGVWLPPGGAAYQIVTVVVGNGVELYGTGTFRFPGATAANSDWTIQGSWLQPTHASSSAVTLGGHGSACRGINFIHAQTAPSGSFAPTTYGWCIDVATSHTTVENVRIVNAYDGIWFNYTTGSGGGTNVVMRDVIVSAFHKRLKTTCVNDAMYWSNIHCRNLWYSSDADVVDYIRANTLDWDCGYTDNLMVDGIEFFEASAIKFTDETCLGNTHSLFNGQLDNVQFNLPQKSMQVAASTTTVRAYFGVTVAQQGDAFGLTWSDTMFDLASDNVDISFSDLTVVNAGGVVFNIGGGAGGIVRCGKLDIQNYSSVSAGQVGIALETGARFDAGNVVNFYKNTSPGAGARVSGAGTELFNTAKYQFWQVYSTFFQLSATGTGSYADASTGLLSRPGLARYYQARITGSINVTAASGGTTMSFRLSGISGCEITGIATAATGFQNFDTGWVDITEAELAALGTVGRLQHNTDAAVTWESGEITVLFR